MHDVSRALGFSFIKKKAFGGEKWKKKCICVLFAYYFSWKMVFLPISLLQIKQLKTI